MRKAAIVLAVALAIVAGVGVWSYFSPWIYLSQLNGAFSSGDLAAIDATVDWNGVRDKMIADAAGAALAESGLQPGDEAATDLILAIQNQIDSAITPERMLGLYQAWQKGEKTGEIKVKGDYMSVGKYLFALQSSSTGKIVALRLKRLGPGSWKLDQVLFLNPPKSQESK